MTGAQVEYVGFKANVAEREYTLRLKRQDVSLQFTLVIPSAAFLSGRARFQDAPEICFQKLHREILACSDGLPEARLAVTDADLEAYRASHLPNTPRRRPKPPILT
jgi:hypothetical protein